MERDKVSGRSRRGPAHKRMEASSGGGENALGKNSESRPVHRGQGGPYTGARPGPYTGATSLGNWPVTQGPYRTPPGPYTGAISSKPFGWRVGGASLRKEPRCTIAPTAPWSRATSTGLWSAANTSSPTASRAMPLPGDGSTGKTVSRSHVPNMWSNGSTKKNCCPGDPAPHKSRPGAGEEQDKSTAFMALSNAHTCGATCHREFEYPLGRMRLFGTYDNCSGARRWPWIGRIRAHTAAF